MTSLLVPRRFCGPPVSGNGGWTAGALAALTGHSGAVEVTLRQPPPLEVAMPVHPEGGRFVARWGEDAVAEARPVADTLEPVEPVDPETAGAAEAAYAGHGTHPFPTCFACGPARAEGDGLRIFPGSVAPSRVAATWRPGPDLADPARPEATTTPVTWAARPRDKPSSSIVTAVTDSLRLTISNVTLPSSWRVGYACTISSLDTASSNSDPAPLHNRIASYCGVVDPSSSRIMP